MPVWPAIPGVKEKTFSRLPLTTQEPVKMEVPVVVSPL
jgi:hypothetical protein